MAVVAAATHVVAVRLPESSPPLAVDGLEAGVSEAGTLDVVVTVASSRDRPAAGRVWWLLAPPGAGGEWDRRVYQSSVRPVEVFPGHPVRLAWTDPVPLPAGTYTISAWVHVPGRSGYVHGDGRVVRDRRVVIPPGGLLRARPPSSDLRVEHVDLPSLLDEDGLIRARVTVANTAGGLRRARLVLVLSPAAGDDDRDWWRAERLWWGRPEQVEVAGGATQTVAMAVAWPADPAGRMVVRALLADLTPQRDEPLDEVAVPVPLSSLVARRTCPPAGCGAGGAVLAVPRR